MTQISQIVQIGYIYLDHGSGWTFMCDGVSNGFQYRAQVLIGKVGEWRV